MSCRPRFSLRREIIHPTSQSRHSQNTFTRTYTSTFSPFFHPSASHILAYPTDTMNETTPSPSPAHGSKAPSRSKSSASPGAGTKRKRTTGPKFYAVKKGFAPGVYEGWKDCLAQITGFKGAICKLYRAVLQAQRTFERADKPFAKLNTT